jgi:hypothetical protein
MTYEIDRVVITEPMATPYCDGVTGAAAHGP